MLWCDNGGTDYSVGGGVEGGCCGLESGGDGGTGHSGGGGGSDRSQIWPPPKFPGVGEGGGREGRETSLDLHLCEGD